MSQPTTMTTTLQQVNFFLFLFAFTLALLIITVMLFYNIGRGLNFSYTHEDQQGQARYRYYATLALVTLFAWNSLLDEQEACALRMAGDVMSRVKEMKLLGLFAIDKQNFLV